MSAAFLFLCTFLTLINARKENISVTSKGAPTRRHWPCGSRTVALPTQSCKFPLSCQGHRLEKQHVTWQLSINHSHQHKQTHKEDKCWLGCLDVKGDSQTNSHVSYWGPAWRRGRSWLHDRPGGWSLSASAAAGLSAWLDGVCRRSSSWTGWGQSTAARTLRQ